MIKSIAMLRRKKCISKEEFVDYYENHHSKLILRLLPGITDYRRNYVDREGAFVYFDAFPMDFDVVTELKFADRAAYDRFVAKATEPNIARQIAEDEANLFDRGGTRMFVVEEMVSHLDQE